MVNKNDIKKKEDAIADSALYNGRKLNAGEKTIFDHDDIKNDLTKIRDVAEILEAVIKAKEEGVKNTVLFSKLKGYKTSHPDSVKVINEKNSNQFNIAYTLLEGFETPSDDKTTLQKQIKDVDAQISTFQVKLGRNKNKKSELSKNASKAETKRKNFASQKSALGGNFRSHLVGLDIDANGNFTNTINTNYSYTPAGTTTPTHVNQRLINIVNLYQTRANSATPLYKTTIRYVPVQRNYITGTSLREIGYRVFEMMKNDIDKDILFGYIDNNLTFTPPVGSTLTTKKQLKDKWEELLKCEWGRITQYEKAYTWEDLKSDGKTSRYDPFKAGNSITKWPDGSQSGVDAVFPYEKGYFDFVGFIDFAEIVFPDSKLDNSNSNFHPLFKKGGSGSLPSSVLDKNDLSFPIFGAYTEDITDASLNPATTGQGLFLSKWLKEKKPDQEQYSKTFNTGQPTNIKGILQYFWDSGFKDAADRTSGRTKWQDSDGNSPSETERKVLLEMIEWIKDVKRLARSVDGVEVSEEVLEKVGRETIKEFSRLRKEKGIHGGKETFMLSREKVDTSVFKIDPNSTLALPSATSPDNWKRYLSLEALEQEVYELGLKEQEQEIIRKGYEKHLNDLISQDASTQAEIDDLEAEKKILQDRINDLDTKDLPTTQNNFLTLYKDGPPLSGTTKYLPAEISRLDSLLVKIGQFWETKPPTPDNLEEITDYPYKLDPTYKGYYLKIKQLKSDLTPWQSKKDLYQESGVDAKERSKAHTIEQLEEVKNAYEEIDKLRKLTEKEKLEWEDVKKGKSIEDGDSPPPSDLTANELNSIFGTTGLSASDIHESDWKAATNFNTKDNLEKLIKNYKKGAPDHTGLQQHLSHEDWGKDDKRGGEKIDGTDWWEKFVKKEPKFVIGAIRHYEWEVGKGQWEGKPKDSGITTEMTNANDEAKAKELNVTVKEKWDTNKAAHIAQFLYRKAVGKSGKELIKESVAIEAPGNNDDEQNGEEGHFGKYWYWYVGGGLIIAALIGAAIYFWDDISKKLGWSKDEDTEKDEENE